MHISVVSPVYRAEKILDELVKRIIESVSEITKDFEIILVDDGSPDDSWGSIERNCKRDSRVKGIKLTRNFGQHYAITSGLDFCKGDWVVVMDCDMQDLPEEIPKLYAKALEGFDVVLAKRSSRSDSHFKRFSSWLFYKFFNYLSDMDYDYQVGGFRVISKRVVGEFKQMREQPRYFNALIYWMGFPTVAIDVEHGKRFAGKSTYDVRKLIKHSLEAVVSNSEKPLIVSIRIGFIMSFLSFIYGSYLLIRTFIVGSPVSGWSSLIVSLYFLSGMIITVLGIISIYLGKAFLMIKNRPLYIVNKTEGFSVRDEIEKICV